LLENFEKNPLDRVCKNEKDLRSSGVFRGLKFDAILKIESFCRRIGKN